MGILGAMGRGAKQMIRSNRDTRFLGNLYLHEGSQASSNVARANQIFKDADGSRAAAAKMHADAQQAYQASFPKRADFADDAAYKQAVKDYADGSQAADVARARAGLDAAHDTLMQDGVGGYLGAARDWLTAADRKGNGRAMTLAARYGSLAAGSVALGTAGRMVTGNGGMLHDRDGNFDIAGIPFF